ncbi:MAG: DegT/DnrJ/EryC1/StrS family aminotransferase [Candidatus Sericytochromatia bacterium]
MSNYKKLAINGGTPVRTDLFPAYNTITQEEIDTSIEVLRSGNLSQFLGAPSNDFLGGPKVKEFEKLWAKMFDSDYCISMNSATSGLFASIGACGIGPGDEVIVSPYSMSASAICPIIYGAVPVFADIQDDIFTLCPKSIEKNITKRTKAIVVVHIFGHPADMDSIIEIAKKYNLFVIEDCAQAPLAEYKNKKVGTIGDIGIFSLNYHKHIHTGEGAMITTNNKELAKKLQLIRNHSENSLDNVELDNYFGMFGFNYRLTEIQAAIGITQLKRLKQYIEERIENCNYISEKLKKLIGIITPVVYKNSKHVYYVQALKFKQEIIGIHRNKFVNAIAAELPSAKLRESTGKLISSGYVKPLYLQSIYQKRNISKCSFNCSKYDGEVSYEKGLCPTTEKMHYEELFTHEYMRPGMSKKDLDDFIYAVEKVYENRSELSR